MKVYKAYIFALIFLASCSFSEGAKQKTAFQEDANRYCEVHGFEYWQKDNKLEALNSLNGMEKQAELIRVFRAAVKTDEMQQLIFDEGGSLPAKEFYPFLQKELPKLTGEPFVCPAIPEFYLVE